MGWATRAFLEWLKLYGPPAFERVPVLQTPSSYPPPSSAGLFHSQLGTNSFSLMLFCGWFCFYKSAVFGLEFGPSGFQCLTVQPWSSYLPSLCSTSAPGKTGHRLLWISGRINEILRTKNLTQGRIPGACVCGSRRARILPAFPGRPGCPLPPPYLPSPTHAPLRPRRYTPAQPHPHVFSIVLATICKSLLTGQGCGRRLCLSSCLPSRASEAPTSSWHPINIWG